MKLYKIFSVITLLLLAMSCSNDDLGLDNNIPDKKVDKEGAYITVKLGQETIARTTEEAEIKTLTLVLLNKSGEIKGARYLSEGEFTIQENIVTCASEALTFLTQETEGLKVVVVANAMKNPFASGYNTTIQFDGDDCDNGLMIGVSESFSVSSVDNGKENPKLAEVTLEHKTTRVRMGTFTPELTVNAPVSVTSFELTGGSRSASFDLSMLSFTAISENISKMFDSDNTLYTYKQDKTWGMDDNVAQKLYINSFVTNENPKMNIGYSVLAIAQEGSYERDVLVGGNIYQMNIVQKLNTPEQINGTIHYQDCDGNLFPLQAHHQLNWEYVPGKIDSRNGLITADDIYEAGKYGCDWSDFLDILTNRLDEGDISINTELNFENESAGQAGNAAFALAYFRSKRMTIAEWLDNPDIVLTNTAVKTVIIPAYITYSLDRNEVSSESNIPPKQGYNPNNTSITTVSTSNGHILVWDTRNDFRVTTTSGILNGERYNALIMYEESMEGSGDDPRSKISYYNGYVNYTKSIHLSEIKDCRNRGIVYKVNLTLG